MAVIEPVETLKSAALASVFACHAVISLLHPKVKYNFMYVKQQCGVDAGRFAANGQEQQACPGRWLPLLWDRRLS